MCFIYLDKNYIILRDDFKQRLNFCKWGSYVLFLWLCFEWWRLSCFVTSPPAYMVCQINLLFFHTYLQLGWFAMMTLEHLECLQWSTVTCILIHTTYIELILFITAYHMQKYGFSVSRVLPHKSPQNCQAHSNNCLSVFDHFVGPYAGKYRSVKTRILAYLMQYIFNIRYCWYYCCIEKSLSNL